MWACMLYEDKEKEMDFVYPTDTTQEYKYYTENGSIWQQHHGTGEKPMVSARINKVVRSSSDLSAACDKATGDCKGS
ncbi:hypothetical protein AK812_SmicGene47579 [Symbiodinium microadriaticum]|uniref:Uncharacterized protein n=1 Tax=Symbiodinium microadriaticum TaxID=2951 RepID=A0A1Q9BRM3_SYMMI|nr:hypothetical protein AK812_SmicGene47579 [Symbiodinium microadriaticum]